MTDPTPDEINAVLGFLTENIGKLDDAAQTLVWKIIEKLDNRDYIKRILNELDPSTLDEEMKTTLQGLASASQKGGDSLNEGDPAKEFTQADIDNAVAAALEEEQGKTEKLVAAAVEKAKTDLADEQGKAQDQAVSAAVKTEQENTNKLIAAAVEKAKSATLDEISRQALVTDVIQMQVSAGIIKDAEVIAETEKIKDRASAALMEDKALIQKVLDVTATPEVAAAARDKFAQTQIAKEGNSAALKGKLDGLNDLYIGGQKS